MKNLSFLILFCLIAVFSNAQDVVKDTTTVATIGGKEYVVTETTYDDESIIIKKHPKKIDASEIVSEYQSKIEFSAREAFNVFNGAQKAGILLDNIEMIDNLLMQMTGTSILEANAIGAKQLVGTYDMSEFGTVTTLVIADIGGALGWTNGKDSGNVAVYNDNIIKLVNWRGKEPLSLYMCNDGSGSYRNLDGIYILLKAK